MSTGRPARNARRGSGLIVVFLALAAASAPGQVLRVDCGDLNGFESSESGWLLLQEDGSLPGITLTPTPLDTVHIGYQFEWPLWPGVLAPPDILSTDPDQLALTHRQTSLQLANGTVLAIAGLPANRLHRVRLELGALYPWIEPDATGLDFAVFPTALHGMQVDIQQPFDSGAVTWIPAAKDIRGVTGEKASTWDSGVGSIIVVWVLAQTDGNGTLRLRFSTAGGEKPLLTAFEVHDHEPLPLVYRRGPAGPLTAFTSAVQPFVDAFNDGDFVLAEQRARALADPFDRGVALMHLAGWLDGSRDELFHLADDAAEALAAAPGHPAGAWLLDELDSFTRALQHAEARGHGWGQACPPEGPGFLNDDCTGQSSLSKPESILSGNVHMAVRQLAGLIAPVSGTTVLDDLADWNAGTLSPGVWEPSPLVFAAAKLTATLLVDINPKLTLKYADPLSFEMRAQIQDLLDGFLDLGFAATDFPRDMELHLFREYVESGEHPSKWESEELLALFTPEQMELAWWGDVVATAPSDPGAPQWANLQREQSRLTRAVTDYWVEERLRRHELGGGWGDDVELLGQLFKPYAAYQGPSDRWALDAVDELVRYGIDEQGLVVDGYYAAVLDDVEHNAEFTTFTGFAHRGVYGRGARSTEIALGVAKHLLANGDTSAAFAAPTVTGRLHFKSFVFNAYGASEDPEDQIDILLDGRAMAPAVAEALTAPVDAAHPLRVDLTQWASGWAGDAMETTGGKPFGWVGPVQWPSNDYGVNGWWFSTLGSPNDTSDLTAGQIAYALDAMRMVYRTSGEPTRWIYLVPAARVFRSVKEWEDAGSGSAPTGSSSWAGSLLKSSPRFGPLVIALLADLRDEPNLRAFVDPVSGATYVDDVLIDRMETWVEVEFNGQGNITRYSLGEVQPCGVGYKFPNPLWGAYQTALDYYAPVFPLLTKHAIRTDRVFLNIKGAGPSTFNAAANGDVLTEGLVFRPLVRWSGDLDANQIAFQCNEKAYDGTAYSAFVYNFATHAADLTMHLEEGLVPGRYSVAWGTAIETCDVVPAGGLVGSLTVQKRGAGVPVTVTVRPGLNLVTARRLGPADSPPAAYDLSADTPTVRFGADPPGAAGPPLVVEGRIVNFGSVASPAATATLSASLLDVDGKPVTLPGQPAEIPLGTFAVPPLGKTTAWTLADHVVSATLDVGAPDAGGGAVTTGGEAGSSGGSPAPAAGGPGAGGGTSSTSGADDALDGVPVALPGILLSALEAGMGLSVRLRVEADGREGDLLDNDTTRAWRLRDILTAAE